jgi:hypothetical protein
MEVFSIVTAMLLVPVNAIVNYDANMYPVV